MSDLEPKGPFRCPGCNGERGPRFVACKPCWGRVPFTLRQAFTKANLETRRGMLRDILRDILRHLRPKTETDEHDHAAA